MTRLTSIVCSLITGAVERFRDWTAHRSTFEEIQLRIDGYRSEAEVILPKLKDALELIREHAPIRLARIRRVVRCIQVCYIPHVRVSGITRSGRACCIWNSPSRQTRRWKRSPQ